MCESVSGFSNVNRRSNGAAAARVGGLRCEWSRSQKSADSKWQTAREVLN